MDGNSRCNIKKEKNGKVKEARKWNEREMVNGKDENQRKDEK